MNARDLNHCTPPHAHGDSAGGGRKEGRSVGRRAGRGRRQTGQKREWRGGLGGGEDFFGWASALLKLFDFEHW